MALGFFLCYSKNAGDVKDTFESGVPEAQEPPNLLDRVRLPGLGLPSRTGLCIDNINFIQEDRGWQHSAAWFD